MMKRAVSSAGERALSGLDTKTAADVVAMNDVTVMTLRREHFQIAQKRGNALLDDMREKMQQFGETWNHWERVL